MTEGQAARASTDGRLLRSERSRQRIADALYELVGEGELTPSAQMVADRAGVGIRTVFRLFSDMDALYATIDARLEVDVAPFLRLGPKESASLGERVEAMIAARVEIVSQATPILGRVDSSMSDAAIMRAVVIKVRPGLESKLDAHADSPGYLRACFDDALEAHNRNTENSAVIGLAAAHAATANERGDSLDNLRDQYIANMGRK